MMQATTPLAPIPSGMGWTDERVELLKKLWLDGLSASQISKKIGGDITRNAVIGKVHRLGLSGRAVPSQPARPVFKAPSVPRPLTAPAPRRVLPAPEVMLIEAGPPPAQEKSLPSVKQQIPVPQPVYYPEEPGSATILMLDAHMCKWPIGDPMTDGFTYCGRRAGDGPYCVKHARKSYQPQQARKGSGAAELARSLRRYIY